MKLMGQTYHISAGFRLNLPQLTASENQYLYGDDWAPEASAYNYEIQVFWPQDSIGAEQKIKEVIKTFDHCLLNEKFPQMSVPTLEAFTQLVWLQTKSVVPIQSVKVKQANYQFCEIVAPGKLCLAWEFQINALHRHHNEELSEQDNAELYGKCSRVHGHEYRIVLRASGALDPKTKVLLPRTEMSNLFHEYLRPQLEGQLLNDVIGNTSGELLLKYLRQSLINKVSDDLQLDVELIETRKNSFFTPRAILGELRGT